MRITAVSITFAILVSGCSSIDTVVREPPGEVSETISMAMAMSVEEAFHERFVELGSEPVRVSVVPTKLPVVTINNTNLLVVPITNTDAKPTKLKISSTVVRHGDGSRVLFYPVVSFVDESFSIYATIEPKYEFAFDGKTLVNEFKVPGGVNRLLVHTDPEYFEGDFTGSIHPRPGAKEKAYATGAVLGGLVGVGLVHAATDGNWVKEFRFGEVGVLDIVSQ